MREYGKTCPTFWTGQTGRAFKKLGAPAQVLGHYLYTSPHCNMICLYYLPQPMAAHETGLTLEQVTSLFAEFARLDFAHYDPENEIVWVVNGAHYQIAPSLKEGDKRIQHIGKQLYCYEKSTLIDGFVRKYGNAFHLETVGFPQSILQAPSQRPSDAPCDAPMQAPCKAPCQGPSQARSSSSSSSSEQEKGAVAVAVSRGSEQEQEHGTVNRGRSSARRQSAAPSSGIMGDFHDAEELTSKGKKQTTSDKRESQPQRTNPTEVPTDVDVDAGQRTWKLIANHLKPPRISQQVYDTAVSPARALGVSAGVLYIVCPPLDSAYVNHINTIAPQFGLKCVEFRTQAVTE